ncbi:MAG TPA: copper-containing nitrite reductase [Candidatus Acidoferrales bacterium]|nr:copper-containing nitrite reductase [Candidatus Acidoferrales bacterium]
MNVRTEIRTILFLGTFLPIILLAVVNSGCETGYSNEMEGTEDAVLTSAPNVPPPIIRNHPSKVVVHLFTKEKIGRLADGVQYQFWTFDGTVPGPMIRVREGDLVEIHLSNDPSDMMAHNIDLHAVIGPGGGAASSVTPPGHTSVFSFKALHPGLYVYHCATPPVPMHIANGMYGLILVQPKEGFPQVDKEFYIMQSEFYTTGEFGDSGLQQFDLQKALDERPSYVVFNGSVGSLTGKNALTAETGQIIRIFVGNIGPNLISSFHIIGEVFDKVYGEGGSTVTEHDIQTTLIPAGGAAIVEFKTEVPGTYSIVDHSVFRSFNKGAVGQLVVTGKGNELVYSGKQADEIYLGQPSVNNTSDESADDQIQTNVSTQQVSAEETGQQIFDRTCIACHQSNGQGIPNVFPPLAGSDFLKNNQKTAIDFVLHGHSGTIMVNGKAYNNVMPPQPLDDQQIAKVLTFVRSSFGNKMGPVAQKEIEQIRSAKMISLNGDN